MAFSSAQQAAARTACRQAFVAPRLAHRVACSGGRSAVGRVADAAPDAGGGPARRGVLLSIAGSAAAGMLGSRSVAAAAASVDQAEQVGVAPTCRAPLSRSAAAAGSPPASLAHRRLPVAPPSRCTHLRRCCWTRSGRSSSRSGKSSSAATMRAATRSFTSRWVLAAARWDGGTVGRAAAQGRPAAGEHPRRPSVGPHVRAPPAARRALAPPPPPAAPLCDTHR